MPNKPRHRSLITASLLLSSTLAAGCMQPLHLQYDYSRAYTQVMTTQADLTRESVAGSDYVLSGIEALELRQRATESATDEESGEAELTNSFQTQ